MKVFIHYKPPKSADFFEGTRLRKTLKGACEVVDVPWVDAPQEGVSVAHFISPADLLLLKQQKGFEGFGKGPTALVMSKMLQKSDKDYASKPDIKWNFTKFIVDRNGNVVKRFEPTADMKEVRAFVESLI